MAQDPKPEWHEELVTKLDAAVIRLTNPDNPLPPDELESLVGGVVALLSLAWETGVPTRVAHRIALHENLPLVIGSYGRKMADTAKYVLQILVDFKYQSDEEPADDFMMPDVLGVESVVH